MEGLSFSISFAYHVLSCVFYKKKYGKTGAMAMVVISFGRNDGLNLWGIRFYLDLRVYLLRNESAVHSGV